jgi:glucokinase
MLLVGDIGGTNTRLAVVPVGAGKPLLEARVRSADHASLKHAIDAVLQGQRFRFRAAAFGIAGPIVDNRCTATNLPWKVDGNVLARQLKVPKVKLVNDLVALAYGALAAPKQQLVSLNGETLPRTKGGNLAILAAGTGLGEAALVWDSDTQRHVPLGTEGGHSDFAPREPLEDELRSFLAARHGRVSTERILAGPGLKTLYEFFRDVKKVEVGEAPDPGIDVDFSAEVTRLGLGDASPCARAAVDLFVKLYGAEAGNVALRYMATGGVFVAGNIANVLSDRLRSAAFRDAFTHKGRFSVFLEGLPLALVTDSNIGLQGAAHVARTLLKGRSK